MRRNAPKRKPQQNVIPKQEPYVSPVQVPMSEKYYRPNTKWFETPLHFVFPRGGLGDYINFLPVFEWIGEENKHVLANLYLNEPFRSVADFVLKKYYPRIKVFGPDDFNREVKKGHGLYDGSNFGMFINATGAHLLDLGFMVFASSSEPYPGYNRLPKINYTLTPPELIPQKPYAVFTPGATVKARAMPPKAFNELVSYTHSLGILPVFLGKSDFAVNKKDVNYKAVFDEANDYSLGLDLREKTTLLEATQIMSEAKFVLGVDNGLLHFAGCTETPIIFGHTVTTVKQREIRRTKGKTINITVEKKDLACISCQANMRYIIGHSFAKCIYDDYACLNLLFSNNCNTWKNAIEMVL